LIVDEYHMLTEASKAQLFEWILPNLAWLRVVLVGNRQYNHDKVLLDKARSVCGGSVIIRQFLGRADIDGVTPNLVKLSGDDEKQFSMDYHRIQRLILGHDILSFRSIRPFHKLYPITETNREQVADILLRKSPTIGHYMASQMVWSTVNRLYLISKSAANNTLTPATPTQSTPTPTTTSTTSSFNASPSKKTSWGERKTPIKSSPMNMKSSSSSSSLSSISGSKQYDRDNRFRNPIGINNAIDLLVAIASLGVHHDTDGAPGICSYTEFVLRAPPVLVDGSASIGNFLRLHPIVRLGLWCMYVLTTCGLQHDAGWTKHLSLLSQITVIDQVRRSHQSLPNCS
jgi:hypothetical protein